MLKYAFFTLFLTLSSFKTNTVLASQEEVDLRDYLFSNYEKESRPIKDINKPVDVEMGLAIQTLEQFNQKTETIKLNIWFRMNWMNEYMSWTNRSEFSMNSIDVNPDNIWTPDIELLNAASLPEIYTLKGGLMLYNTGECMWSRPGIFMFSCPLDLHDFPFDVQKCSMTFASWIFNNNYLNLVPYEDPSKAVDILNDFSHSEWNVKSMEYYPFNMSIGNGEEKSEITYTIELERFTHYYTLTMGMTITLVYVSFLIMFLPPDNISRTSTAVFIPLTILALQLTIIDKVPVVGYYTLMDKFFLSCFISSMMVSMVSAIIYALITHKSHKVLYMISKFVDINRLRYGKNYKKPEKLELKETKFDNSNKLINIQKEDIEIGDEINNPLRRRTVSYKTAVTPPNPETSMLPPPPSTSPPTSPPPPPPSSPTRPTTPTTPTPTDTQLNEKILPQLRKIVSQIRIKKENSPKYISSDKNENSPIIKTIAYDNKLLDLTDDELLLYSFMTSKIKLADNILRILLPCVFSIYIGVLLNVY